MRKLIATEFVTVDGVIHAPDEWQSPYWNAEATKFKFDELMASDALLLGRVTYELFAEAWPTITDEEGFADKMNSMPKHVATTSLTEFTWNSHPIEGDVVEGIKKLKQQDGKNILIYGSGQLIRSLIPHDVIDEYVLLIHPVVLGHGQRLFDEGNNKGLKLIDTTTLGEIVAVTYEHTT
jgi:dihydrofolate reductase